MVYRTLLAVLTAGGVIMSSGCASTSSGKAPASLYKSEAGRSAAFQSYDRSMALWTAGFEDDWVDTAYGCTHVVISGPADGQPLFMLPGLFGDATMWYANAGELARKYRVYALDMLNYGGKGEPAGKAISSVEDYAAWYGAILDRYGYEKAAVAGLSYSSWLSLALAREMPERIAAAILLDPSETFMPMDGGIAWKGFWAFAFFPDRAKYAEFFNWMGGGYSDPRMDTWFEHMLDVIEFGSARMDRIPQHRIYKPEELSAVTMPTLVMVGGKPILYKDSMKFRNAAARALPGAQIEIVPDTGHGLNMEKPEYVNAHMLAFLDEHYH